MACRSLVQAVIPRPDVAPILQEHYVALAGDADLPQPEVQRLMSQLKTATMLPFVILADAEESFLDGSAGTVEPEKLQEMLAGALA